MDNVRIPFPIPTAVALEWLTNNPPLPNWIKEVLDEQGITGARRAAIELAWRTGEYNAEQESER